VRASLSDLRNRSSDDHLRIGAVSFAGPESAANVRIAAGQRRLRLNGLIRRLPHTNRYTLTGDGIRIAILYTKVYNRLLVPLTAAGQPQAPPELRAALWQRRPRPPSRAPSENLTQTSTTSRSKIAKIRL
jgi:hypothetical protein